MPATYEPIASQTLGSASATITFSNIPSTYTDLILVGNGTSSFSPMYIGIRFNGDTANNYSRTYLFGSGSSAISGRQSNFSNVVFGTFDTSTPRVFLMSIQSYANTNVNKTLLVQGAWPGEGVERIVGLWRNTAAITSLSLFADNGSYNFSTGTTMSLYGIKAA